MTKLALQFPGGIGQIDEGDSSIFGSGWNFGNKPTPAEIINLVIPFVFVIAGIILLGMIVAGGFTIFTSAGNPEKIKKGQGMIVSGLVGFLIIFAAYWIIELLQITLGIKVL
ncbi:TPA: hypothetical protein DEB02_01725 [Candidatus Beckwithbacteria bacterium]|nr:hypothetical protein [Candidatus Beckwithbacteria bacterium]